MIEQLEQAVAELKRTVATLKEKNVKLKAELSTAEQEIKIRNTVEREHRVSLRPLHNARRLINIPDQTRHDTGYGFPSRGRRATSASIPQAKVHAKTQV